jgi:hypothetical protein
MGDRSNNRFIGYSLLQPRLKLRWRFGDNGFRPPLSHKLILGIPCKENNVRFDCRANGHIAQACYVEDERYNVGRKVVGFDRKSDAGISVFQSSDAEVYDSAIFAVDFPIAIWIRFTGLHIREQLPDILTLGLGQAVIDRELDWLSSEGILALARRGPKVAGV